MGGGGQSVAPTLRAVLRIRSMTGAPFGMFWRTLASVLREELSVRPV